MARLKAALELADLEEARATLCDLLIGRRFRLVAAQHLRAAIMLEDYGSPAHIIGELLNEAAHCEWLAQRSEQGQIMWGGRLNRCGYQPEYPDDDDDDDDDECPHCGGAAGHPPFDYCSPK